MDFGDSPPEHEFRLRLREWLKDNAPHLGASSASDAYWEAQPAWHRSLYDAGYVGLSWPTEYGGHGLPAVYDVILDEELATAGAPPRPHLGYLVQGILRHGSDGTAGARASANPMPVPIWHRCARGPSATATST
jgi:alkylation response protein AidB-like acyl-CoA dehydrogenase